MRLGDPVTQPRWTESAPQQMCWREHAVSPTPAAGQVSVDVLTVERDGALSRQGFKSVTKKRSHPNPQESQGGVCTCGAFDNTGFQQRLSPQLQLGEAFCYVYMSMDFLPCLYGYMDFLLCFYGHAHTCACMHTPVLHGA